MFIGIPGAENKDEREKKKERKMKLIKIDKYIFNVYWNTRDRK